MRQYLYGAAFRMERRAFRILWGGHPTKKEHTRDQR